MRSNRRFRSVAALASAVCVLTASVALGGSLALAPAFAPSVQAHCPGTAIPNSGRAYSAGTRSIAGVAVASGIRGTIGWVNPNICSTPAGNAFSLEVVNICSTGTCAGWVQVGWRKDQGVAAPRLFCEFHSTSGTNTIMFGPAVTQVAHDYKYAYDPFDSVWDCYLDGSGKFSKGSLGFTSGTWLVVQGETNATHAQIGANAPSKLSITDMQYRNAANQWPMFDRNGTRIDDPYGGDRPAAGQWRNWTNAH